MSALSPGPAQGLVNDFVTWGFVATILATWVVVALFAARWRATSRRIDHLAAMDEQSRRSAQTGRWTQ